MGSMGSPYQSMPFFFVFGFPVVELLLRFLRGLGLRFPFDGDRADDELQNPDVLTVEALNVLARPCR